MRKADTGDALTGDGRPENNLLRALKPDDYELIRSDLESVQFPARQLLYNPGDHVGMVYFPCGPSLISYLVTNEDGHDVETLLIGREGAVGGIVSRGNLPAFTRMIVQFSGQFVQLRLDSLEKAKSTSPSLHALFARYADCLMAQMFQSTACNAIHSIEQRTAKWIISAIERTGDLVVPMTQEQLATMLGVGRSYASRVIQTFRREGTLETRRGSLIVVDSAALEAKSCQCNAQVKSHFDAVLRGVYPTENSI